MHRVRVNREISTYVGTLMPGYEYPVPDFEYERLARIGALVVDERAVSAAERTASLIPDEEIDAVARVGVKVNRMARGSTAAR